MDMYNCPHKPYTQTLPLQALQGDLHTFYEHLANTLLPKEWEWHSAGVKVEKSPVSCSNYVEIICGTRGWVDMFNSWTTQSFEFKESYFGSFSPSWRFQGFQDIQWYLSAGCIVGWTVQVNQSFTWMESTFNLLNRCKNFNICGGRQGCLKVACCLKMPEQVDNLVPSRPVC